MKKRLFLLLLFLLLLLMMASLFSCRSFKEGFKESKHGRYEVKIGQRTIILQSMNFNHPEKMGG